MFFRKLLCFFGHVSSATWHGQDWYVYGWKKNYEALDCQRFENGKKLPLLDNARLGPIR